MAQRACALGWRPIDEAKLAGFTPGDRCAVATALATPDICLIQSASAGERVRLGRAIAKLSGERVLLVAPELLAPTIAGAALKANRVALGSAARPLRARPPAKCAECSAGKVAAATYRNLPADHFPLLIALDAHTLDESGLRSIARLADRCVLVGEPGRSLFTQLCEELECEPWIRSDRLICRLHPVPDDQRAESNLSQSPIAPKSNCAS